MSNSSLVSYTKISPNKTSPRNHVIDTITIHCMAGNLTVERCGDVFAATSRKASSNYGVGTDGRIALYVDEKDRTWCTSNAANDNRAVTIEVANDGGASSGWHVSDKAMASLIKLCADICKRNNIKKLVWSTDKNQRINHLNGCNMTVHRDYAAKACPGDYLYGKHGYIADEVNKLLGVNTQNTSTTPKPATTAYTQAQFIKDVCAILGVKDAASALKKTPTISATTNKSHALVTPIERMMKALGYYTGTIEADNGKTPSFGNGMTAAVKKYQTNVVKSTGKNVDGVISGGGLTWRKLLGLS